MLSYVRAHASYVCYVRMFVMYAMYACDVRVLCLYVYMCGGYATHACPVCECMYAVM